MKIQKNFDIEIIRLSAESLWQQLFKIKNLNNLNFKF